MQCKDVQETLWLLQSGEADPRSRAQMEEHLRGCPACSREGLALKAVIQNLPKAPRLAESYWNAYNQKILRRLEGKRAVQPLSFGRWVPAMAVGLLLLAGIGIRQYHQYGEKKRIEEIVAHIDVLDNLEILERDDFEKLVGNEQI